MIANWNRSVLAKFGVVALILLMYALYFPPFANAWVGDDYIQFDYIKPFVQRPFTAYKLFNPYELTWYYRPLQNIWLLLNQRILGYNPFGYYAILLGLHAIAIALIYRIARQLKFTYFAAFVAAGLFAIHGHWVDVITWISSVAIVTSGILNLWGISVWISYLKRPSLKKLLFTILISLLALLAHEEGVLLAPFLLLILIVERLGVEDWRLEIGSLRLPDWRLKQLISRQELIAFAFLALVSLAYLYTQLTRKNVTIDISEQSGGSLLTNLTPANVQAFFQSTLFRFTLLDVVATATGTAQILLLAVAFAVLLVWVWYGRKIVRLGLLWTAVHLLLIFGTLWINLPNLYAGRHIYVASIGIVLAIGATVDQITAVSTRTITLHKKQRPIAKAGIFVAVTAFLLLQMSFVLKTQQSWLADTQEEKTAQAQLKTMLPTINSEQHFFSLRFPIAPQFTRGVLQVWYDTPLERPGGSLRHLQANGRATSDYYLFDYADGQLYNLMPDLQEHEETIFLWAKTYTDLLLKEGDDPQLLPENGSIKWQVVNDGLRRQLAMPMTLPDDPNQWVARQFATTVPPNSSLQTAVLPQPNLTYRIRIIGSDGATETIFLLSDSEGKNWQETAVPLDNYWGETVIISLEVRGEGEEDTAVYWANPRLVIDND